MIYIECKENNPKGKIGIEHFIHTYGIILSPKKSFVNLYYGNALPQDKCFFKIIVNNYSNVQDFKEFILYASLLSKRILNLEDFSKFIDNVPFISKDDNSIYINQDIFSFIGKCISGELESFWKNTSTLEKEKFGKVPFVDIYERMLFDILLLAFEKMKLPLICKAFWPGKKFAVCLTHDVDEIKKTYQWVTKPIMNLKNLKIRLLKRQLCSLRDKLKGKEPYWTFEDLINLEDSLYVKSSFYFLKERKKVELFSPTTWKLMGRRYDFNDVKIKKIMKQLFDKGWDIGLHGSYGSFNDPEMLEREMNELQFSLGKRIIGTRQHHLNLDIPKTWDIQERIGLEYDTTLGFKDHMGFRGGTCFPYHIFSGSKRLELIELPLTIMDTYLLKNNEQMILREFNEMINIVCEFNGLLTLLWHHSAFNENEYPGWGAYYKTIIELCKNKNAWITSAKEISDWWKFREGSEIRSNYEENRIEIISNPAQKSHFLNVYKPKDMIIEGISNAKIIEANKDILRLLTNTLNNNECIEIYFSE